MKSDKQLIDEILEHIKEEDYPGSSFNCGVDAIWIDDEDVYFYYPAGNVLMKTNRKSHENIIVARDVFTEDEAMKLINK